MLPYYEKGSSQHSIIHSKIYRNSIRYGFQKKVIRCSSNGVLKKCVECGVLKSVEMFHISQIYKGVPYYYPRCRPCFNKINGPTHRKERRLKALRKVSPELKCVNCGCDDYRLLEFNHKNGGGGIECRNSSIDLAARILFHNRSTDDLELRCRVCNALHYLEMKVGKIPMTVTWNSSDSN